MAGLSNLGLAATTANRLIGGNARNASIKISNLSSGLRVGRAADDIAALAIGSRLGREIAELDALNQAITRASSGAQLADATLDNTTQILIRMRKLATQSSSEHLSSTERALLDMQFQALRDEIDRVAKDTALGDVKLLETDFKPIYFQTDFEDGVLPRNTYVDGAQGGNPATVGVTDGSLQLLNGMDGGVIGVFASNEAFLTDTGINAKFTYTARGDIDETSKRYGGGFSFWLVDGDEFDATAPVIGGGASSNLGYRQMPGGFIGIGFDAFGDFTSPSGASSGVGNNAQAIAVRGPESDNFNLINFRSVAAYGGVDGVEEEPTLPPFETAVRRDVELDLDENFILNVQVTFQESGQTVQIVEDFDLGAVIQEALRPETVKFGFAATVAGRRNNFLINDLEVLASVGVRNRMAGAALNLGGRTQDGAQLTLPLFDATANGLTLGESSIETVIRAETAMERIDFAVGQVAAARVVLGTYITIYENAVNEHWFRGASLNEARGLLLNADIPDTITQLLNAEVATQAGIGVLGSTDQLRRLVADTLRQNIDQSRSTE